MPQDTNDGQGDGGSDGPRGRGGSAGHEGAVDLAAVFTALPGVDLVLAPDAPRYTMLAATDGRLAATMTTREGTLGRRLFEVFPDANPANDAPSGVGNLRASLETVLRTRVPHRMAVQRYDLRRPDGTWEERYWAPLNVPVLGPDGAVRHLLHRVEAPSPSPAGAPRAGGVAFTVADTGRGIAADQLPRVFEPFVQVDQRLTRAEEGTGLGLAISRDLARGMGGDLRVRSREGAGAAFTVALRRVVDAAGYPTDRRTIEERRREEERRDPDDRRGDAGHVA